MDINIQDIDRAIFTFQYMLTRCPYNKDQQEAIELAQKILIIHSTAAHKRNGDW